MIVINNNCINDDDDDNNINNNDNDNDIILIILIIILTKINIIKYNNNKIIITNNYLVRMGFPGGKDFGLHRGAEEPRGPSIAGALQGHVFHHPAWVRDILAFQAAS